MSDIEKRIAEIVWVGLRLQPSKVVPEARFREDLGADNLRLIVIIMDCEREFGIEISDDDAEAVDTVADLNRLASVLVSRKA